MGEKEEREVSGRIERIGLPEGLFEARGPGNIALLDEKADFPDHTDALKSLLQWLKKGAARPEAVAHRLVQGGPEFRKVRLIDETLVKTLKGLVAFAPEHLPHQLKAVETCKAAYPELPHVACFDTAFHSTMPDIARRYPLPGSFNEEGIQRYGFHGLSYEYIAGELKAMGGTGKAVIAHLGNGASMCAINNGQSMDTTMGFTPAGGLMMSSRTGDLDPGVMIYLLKEKNLTPDEVNKLVNHKSGLLGVSGTSTDMEDLLSREKTDERARVAVELFCYQAKKYLGALVAVLGGIETLVFTAGMGENSPEIRKRICIGLGFLGIEISPERNSRNEAVISKDESPVKVMVIKTNEELMMARHAKKAVKEG
jgi:acetate kinase